MPLRVGKFVLTHVTVGLQVFLICRTTAGMGAMRPSLTLRVILVVMKSLGSVDPMWTDGGQL